MLKNLSKNHSVNTGRTLLILPHAGGYGEQYLGLVSALEKRGISTYSMERTPPLSTWEYLIAESIEELVKKFHSVEGSLLLLGHSMGALIGYQLLLASETHSSLSKLKVGLVASSFKAPLEPLTLANHPISEQSQNDFLRSVARFGAISKEFSQNEGNSYFVEKLREDFKLLERYSNSSLAIDTESRTPRQLSSPIWAWFAEKDPSLSMNEVLNWRQLTKREFNFHLFEGDHFFILNNPILCADLIGDYI